MVDAEKRPLSGQVALVSGGATEVGRAIAFALAARGVRVVVTGGEERPLGDVVGEIANGGGKARHLKGDMLDPNHHKAAVEKATSVFGGLDIAIACASAADEGADGEETMLTNVMVAQYTFEAATLEMKGSGRLLAVSSGHAPGLPGYKESLAITHAGEAAIVDLVRFLATKLAPRAITCNVIGAEWEPITADADATDPAATAQLAVFLCSDAGDAITGQKLCVGGLL